LYNSYLYAITAAGPNDLWAGGVFNGQGVTAPLVEHYGVCIFPPTATTTATATRTLTPLPPAPLPCGLSTRFFEGFESGTFGAFTHNPQDPWTVGWPPHSGNFGVSMVVPQNWNGPTWLTTTLPITIPSNASHADLSAWYRAGADDDSSGGVIQASTDGGASWATVLDFLYHTLSWVEVDASFDAYIGRSFLLRLGGHYFGPYGTWVNVDDIHLTLENNDDPNCPTRTPTATATQTPTITPTIAHTPHAGQFEDVPPGSPFYDYVECMGTRQIITGYPCGGPFEPCFNPNKPYFRPNNQVTRGQVSKMISLATGLTAPPACQIQFVDVAPGSTFYPYVRALACHDIVSGYPCGGWGEPCPGLYYRPNNNLTRGQLAKIDTLAAGFSETPTGQTFEDVPPGSTFYPYIERMAGRGIVGGYPCGGPFEPCVPPTNRPYFRPGNDVTRGQTAKIVTNSFFPGCQDPTPTVTATPTRTPTVTVTPPNTAIAVTATPAGPCGLGWDLVPSPDGMLLDVAVVAANDIWATGKTDIPGLALTMHWDGTTWTNVPGPNPGWSATASGVAALATNDVWTVGSYDNHSMITHWDSTGWIIVPSPDIGPYGTFLKGVAAVGPNDIWAVGQHYINTNTNYQTAVLHWDGTGWSVVPSPSNGTNSSFTRIAARTANDIWAVGYDDGGGTSYQTLAEHWDGTSWTIVPTPPNGMLNDVAAVGANDVWAVGSTGNNYTATLILHWDGTNWTIVPSPNLGSQRNWLNGIEAITANDIWVVGGYNNGTSDQTLALHWDGANWTVVPSPNPNVYNYLNGVAAVTANDVWAVGYSYATNSIPALTEHYAPLPCLTSTPTPIRTPSATRTGTPPTATYTPTRTSLTRTATPTAMITTTPTTTITATPTP
jgi:hypothetical protein